MSSLLPCPYRAGQRLQLNESTAQSQSRRLNLNVQSKQTFIGRKPITIPKGCSAEFNRPELKMKGPKGENVIQVPKCLDLEIGDGYMQYFPNREYVMADKRHNIAPMYNMIWGRWRGQTQMLLDGVEKGHEMKLQLVGVGYRCNIQDNTIVLNVGFADQKFVKIPDDIECTIEDKNTVIIARSLNLKTLGDFCVSVKKWRKPDPYKGKGIRWYGQQIKLKSAKTK